MSKKCKSIPKTFFQGRRKGPPLALSCSTQTGQVGGFVKNPRRDLQGFFGGNGGWNNGFRKNPESLSEGKFF